MTALEAGAGKCLIKIPEDYPAVENFSLIHDPIHARAVAFRELEDKGSTVIILSLEITSMPVDETKKIRELVSAETGVAEHKIWVCVTHSFSSPHLLSNRSLKTEREQQLRDAYRVALQEAACEAAGKAVKQLRPATLGVQKGYCDIVANRDIELEAGWWIGTNGDGPSNPEVTVIRLDDAEGRPIALLSHFAMQSSVMDQSLLSDGGKPITSDIAGYACQVAEDTFGEDMVALFLIGAAGDQAPVEKTVNDTFVNGEKVRTDLHEQGFEICSRLGGILGEKICETARRAVPVIGPVSIEKRSVDVTVPAKQYERNLHSLKPTRSYVYESDGTSDMEIEAICLGDIALLGVKPEMNCVTANAIMESSDYDITLVCTLVNGALKYMADQESYDLFRYEALNSPFGRGAAEIVRDKSIELLKTEKHKQEE